MADGLNTPFVDAITRLSGLSTRFFVPGHKGGAEALPLFRDFVRYDLTEIAGADDLSHPTGPLRDSQRNMARVFGSGATLYSAAGTSVCILAMLTLFCRPGGRVVLARGCHASAVRALGLLGAEPVWLAPPGPPAPEAAAEALAAHPGAPLYVTSPDYYGQMADIPALAAVCRRAGAPLLVDNAHGSHLKFLRPDAHPLTLGADAVADSAHKTLFCLTPAALLHLRDASLEPAARDALNLYSSTSPAYPVLMSLDWAAGVLLACPPDYPDTACRLADMAHRHAHLVQRCDDPLRLCLAPARGGWPPEEVEAALRAAGIYPELFDGRRIVLMASPFNTEADFARLDAALAPFAQRAPLPEEEAPPLPLPRQVCGLREALFAPRQRVPAAEAAGRVAASIQAPCPPGVPVVVPGECIGPAHAAALARGGILEVDVLK